MENSFHPLSKVVTLYDGHTMFYTSLNYTEIYCDANKISYIT